MGKGNIPPPPRHPHDKAKVDPYVPYEGDENDEDEQGSEEPE